MRHRFRWIQSYYHWLHGRWPAGRVEKLPELNENSETNIRGVYVVGDLKGIPLLKFSIDSGARAVQTILSDSSFHKSKSPLDLVIVGAGLAGLSAAKEAKKNNLTFKIIEGSEPFSTIINFPKGKPIYTYPKDMKPAGEIHVTADKKETLLDELRDQISHIDIHNGFAEKVEKTSEGFLVHVKDQEPIVAQRVIIAIGRSGNFRKLNVPGEEKDKVYNRLHDPADYSGNKCLVVGGGDSALETAIALTKAGAEVTLSYRKKEFSRPKPENAEMIERLAQDPTTEATVASPVSERITTAAGKFSQSSSPGKLTLIMPSSIKKITDTEVVLQDQNKKDVSLPNDVVFSMIGREAPLNFFRRSKIRLTGEWNKGKIWGFVAFLIFCAALYNWKSGGFLGNIFYAHNWFPTSLTKSFSSLAASPNNISGTIIISASSPSFWYTLAYSILVAVFGIKRIRRRKTPYITVQTTTLVSIQIIPLFILPEIVLPWLGHNGWLPEGLANSLFPQADYGHGREYWRSYGFILAWPLMVYNVFTNQPLAAWLWISGIQTLVLIPVLIYFFGKGSYCGWICSCGALAETLGDTQRTKMVHGAGWNKLNMAGQGILLLAVILLILRITGWILPEGNKIASFMNGMALSSYKWTIDVLLAGIIGYGFYFWYSGRVWCRFFCPLAALMHIYARFSRFRILAEKKKCISCNVCTSVCHQGIDIMNFANKGLPMNDPQCVRCSACVQSCPTGVLTFGQVNNRGDVIKFDQLKASPVQMAEKD